MSLRSATLQDLQNQCRAAGLDTSGDIADLEERLEIHQRPHRKMYTPQSPEDPGVITGEPFPPEGSGSQGSGDIKRPESGVGRKGEKQSEEPKLGSVPPTLCGFEGLDERLDALRKAIDRVKRDNHSLENRLFTLADSRDFYRAQRNRFISTFKNDKLGCATEDDIRVIGEGQLVAHSGDIRMDATLYTGPDARTDVKAFTKLYGILPQMVDRIRRVETLMVFNTHAGVISSNHETGSELFYQLFWEFVRLFKESGEGYDESYLAGAPTDVTRAYRAFVNCINTAVTNAAGGD